VNRIEWHQICLPMKACTAIRNGSSYWNIPSSLKYEHEWCHRCWWGYSDVLCEVICCHKMCEKVWYSFLFNHHSLWIKTSPVMWQVNRKSLGLLKYTWFNIVFQVEKSCLSFSLLFSCKYV
jgi:hypothetical protein